MSRFIDRNKSISKDNAPIVITYQGVKYTNMGKLAEGGTAVCSMLKKMYGSSNFPTYLVKKQLRAEYWGSTEFHDILQHEYNIGKDLHSESIARYCSYDDVEKSIYIEYIDGRTLNNFLETEEGRTYFTGKDAYHHIHDFCIQVLTGMQQIHENRLCHCDLTGNNIMIRNGCDHRAVIIDLGMALTQGKTYLIGTTESQKAPEMKLDGECYINILCDIYMFGQVMRQISQACPIYQPICQLCLQENPEDRYQSVKKIIQAIEDVYSEKVNGEFKRLLSLQKNGEEFKVRDSRVYYGPDFVCDIKDLKFANHSRDYSQLLMNRQNITNELDCLDLTEEAKYNELNHQLNKTNLNIFICETDMIELASNIYEIRDAIEKSTYQRIRNLFDEGRIAEAKDLIDKNTIEDEMVSQRNINRKNSSHTERLVDKMLLYTSICKNDWGNRSRYQEIEPILKECIDTMETINYDKRKMAYMLCRYGYALGANKHGEEAIKQYKKAQTLYQELEIGMPLEYHENMATVHRSIADTYKSIGKYAEAIEEYKKEIDIRNGLIQDKRNQVAIKEFGQVAEIIFDLYIKIGQTENALQYMIHVIDTSKNKPEYIGTLYIAYRCLSIFYSTHSKDIDKSIAYRKECLKLAKMMDVDEAKRHRSKSMTECEVIARMYLEVNNFDEAEKYYRLSLEMSKDRIIISNPFSFSKNIADVKIRKKDYAAAECIYRDICKSPDRHKMDINFIFHLEELITLGDLNLKCGHTEEAKDNFSKASILIKQNRKNKKSEQGKLNQLEEKILEYSL